MEQAVKDRLEDSEASVLVTTPDLLGRVPENDLPKLEKVVLVGENVEADGRYIDYHEEMKQASEEFDIEWVDLEDGLVLQLYFRFNREAKRCLSCALCDDSALSDGKMGA